MANSFYCKECGAATVYASEKPKFCSSCGELFISQTQAPPQNTTIAKKVISRARQQIVTQEDENFEELPQIDKLEIVVRGNPNASRGIRMKDIIGGVPEDTGRVVRPTGKVKRPKIDKAAFMADAKASGRSNPIEIQG